MNLSIKYTTGNDTYAVETMKKLAALTDYISWSALTGHVTEHFVNLNLATSHGEVTIVGKYDPVKETFPVQVWVDNVPLGSFNWHPHNTMGGFDLQQFKDELKQFFDNV